MSRERGHDSDPLLEAALRAQTRRQFLREGSLGIGAMALASLAGCQLPSAGAAGASPGDPLGGSLDDPLAPRPPHYAARAKRIIYLHMAAARSVRH